MLEWTVKHDYKSILEIVTVLKIIYTDGSVLIVDTDGRLLIKN